MKMTGIRTVAVMSAAMLALAMSACGSDEPSSASGDPSSAPSSKAAKAPEDRARETVQVYLDAMKSKDVAKGKQQFCPALHEKFDKTATSEDGDFSQDFALEQSSITKVEAAGNDGHTVSTSLVVHSKKEGANAVKADINYSVHQLGDLWCIYNEEIVGTPSPATS